MPWENVLFTPVNEALSKNIATYRLKDKIRLKGAPEDFSTRSSAISAELTPLAQSVSAYPEMLDKVDVSKKAAGGTQ